MRKLLVLGLLAGLSFPVFAQVDALALYFQKQYEASAEACKKELLANPGRMDSYAVLGWSLLELGLYQEANDYAQKGLTYNRDDVRIVQILGEALFYLGKPVESLKYLEEYASLSPTGERIGRTYFTMGQIFIQLNEFQHADIALSTAVFFIPNKAAWWSRLAFAKEMGGDLRGAISAYDQALRLYPGFTEATVGKQRAVSKLPQG